MALLVAVLLPPALLQDSGSLLVSPGPSFPVLTTAQADPLFDGQRWRMLTVEATPASWAALIGNAVGPSDPTVPHAIPGRAAGPSEAAQMQASTRAASAAAYEILGRDVGSAPRGALVLEVLDGSAARSAGIQPGDAIVAMDGVAVETAEDLIAMPRSGQHQVRLVRAGSVRVVPVSGGADGFGLQVATWFDLDEAAAMPVPPREVGGSSGGLAFALALVDALEPGDLTGGRVVAATGVLGAGGMVDPVVGVPQKLIGAAADDATLAFVPMGSPGGPVPAGMTVVPVASVSDAVSYLCSHGGTGAVCP